MTNLAARIRDARHAARITQKQLADKLHTSPRQIVKYESGEQEPTVSRLLQIAAALGVEPSELLK